MLTFFKRGKIMKFWPYHIVDKDDDDIKKDLRNIMEHFKRIGMEFDIIVFIPNAGIYLSQLFKEIYGETISVRLLTVRRVSTVAQENWFKRLVFTKRWLAFLMRHTEVLFRLIKHRLGCSHKRIIEPITFDVRDKKILVIDDSVDTGTTLNTVKSILVENGAQSIQTACITNYLLPYEVHVDYAVGIHVLIRTKNSRDYYAT
jgi:hypoxanthine phosphoribosyltransferase